MAANPVLVDSSYYIKLLRAKRDPLKELAPLAADRDLAVCGIIRCEVGRALLHPNTLKKFQSFWDVMVNVPTDNALWQEAEDLLWSLDRKGVLLPVTDVVIACCAKRINAVVLTHDNHFKSIPGLRSVDQIDL
ncbi:MAG TPA: PIN domain-containing protein [Verrucomicrobiae bacterium]